MDKIDQKHITKNINYFQGAFEKKLKDINFVKLIL